MDTKNLHFNTKLLIQEMLRRGILCEQIGESGIIKTKFGNLTNNIIEYVADAKCTIWGKSLRKYLKN